MAGWKIALALACVGLMPVVAAAQAPEAAIPVQQARVDDPGHPPIPVAIWAPATGAGLPLVVISHGTGAGPTAHIDTAQALAAAGFVVVAPMHPGDNFQDDSIVGRPEWMANRARHVSRVIDFMVSEWPGRERLNPERVGIFGFSAGGTTALISIGGVPDLARVPAHCAARREFVCDIMAAPTAGAAPPPAWTRDPRIAAAVVAAPGLGFAFAPSGLSGVRVPVQLWAGTADETVPYATNAGPVRQMLGERADFHEATGAAHLSFLAPCGPGGPPPLCQDAPGFDRAAFRRGLNQAIIAFFRRHLGAGAPATLP